MPTVTNFSLVIGDTSTA